MKKNKYLKEKNPSQETTRKDEENEGEENEENRGEESEESPLPFYAKLLVDAKKKSHPGERIQREREKGREPYQGHHVLNKGCLTLYRDIIEKFVRGDEGKTVFGEVSYDDLKKRGIINDKGLPSDFVLQTDPLEKVAKDIEKMTVFKPKDVEHDKRLQDENADVFGCANLLILDSVHSIMSNIFKKMKNNENGEVPISKQIKTLESKINIIIARESYIDSRALDWQKSEAAKKKETAFQMTFVECKGKVRQLFRDIANKREMQLVMHWGLWAFRVSEGLRLGYTVEPCH